MGAGISLPDAQCIVDTAAAQHWPQLQHAAVITNTHNSDGTNSSEYRVHSASHKYQALFITHPAHYHRSFIVPITDAAKPGATIDRISLADYVAELTVLESRRKTRSRVSVSDSDGDSDDGSDGADASTNTDTGTDSHSAIEVVSGEAGSQRFLSALLSILYTSKSHLSSDGNTVSITIPLTDSNQQQPSLSLSQSLSRSHLRSNHPNIPHVDAVLDLTATNTILILTKQMPRTFASLIRSMHQFDTAADMSHESRLFLFYQCLKTLEYLHSRRIVHGNLNGKSVIVTGNLWIYLTSFLCPAALQPSLSPSVSATDRHESCLMQWVNGTLSNFDYLMELNRLAGRELGDTDVADHPILPWVTDFTSQSLARSLRDLTKSKFRLKKGDDQLDFTYHHSPANQTPHHITELFSDITYYVYVSRVTELDTLKRIVRDRFVAAEYPPSMKRIYRWTPDEAIPEFYTNTEIFYSRHKGLGLLDIELPPWTKTPHEFIHWHRQQLESDLVSARLNDWIDVTFGYKLSGAAAIEAKNVPLKAAGKSARRSAFVQLFDRPHPKKIIRNTNVSNAASDNGCESVSETDPTFSDDLPPSESPTPNDEDGNTDTSTATNPVTVTDVPLDPMAAAIEELKLLRYAADFDVLYRSLEGCYQPIDQHNETDINISNDSDNDNDSDSSVASTTTTVKEPLSPISQLIHDFAAVPRHQRANQSTSPNSQLLSQLQSDDIFSLGCLIAELFLGMPLLNIDSHRLYAARLFDPATVLTTLPTPLKSLLLSMIAIDWQSRPSVREIIDHSVFRCSATTGNTYETVYQFVSELRKMQSLFIANTQSVAVTPAVSSPTNASASTITILSDGGVDTLTLRPPSPMFSLPSDQIRTPPVKPSMLLSEMSIQTPTELSPLTLNDRGEGGDDGDSDSDNATDTHTNTSSVTVSHRPSSLSVSLMQHRSVQSPEQETIDWTLGQLQSPTLLSLPLSSYLLLIPHVLALASLPSLRIECLSLYEILAKRLGKSLSSKLLLPSLMTLFTHSDDTELQCQMLGHTMLDSIYNLYHYYDGGREFLAHVRNSLLSPDYRIRETASHAIYAFLFLSLDLEDGNDREVAIRDLWNPMFDRLGRGGSEIIVSQMSNQLPELPLALIQHYMLDNILALIDHGNGTQTSTGEESMPASKSELEIRLGCGLDLLWTILPDLPFQSFQSLAHETPVLRSLLVSLVTARGTTVKVSAMKRLIQCWLFFIHTFATNTSAAIGSDKPPTKSGKSPSGNVSVSVSGSVDPNSGISTKNLRFILPLLPMFAEHLTNMSNHRSFDDKQIAECLSMMYGGLVPLLSINTVRESVSSHQRIESMVKDFTKSADVDRVRKHATLGRNRRGQWSVRQRQRNDDRLAKRDTLATEIANIRELSKNATNTQTHATIDNDNDGETGSHTGSDDLPSVDNDDDDTFIRADKPGNPQRQSSGSGNRNIPNNVNVISRHRSSSSVSSSPLPVPMPTPSSTTNRASGMFSFFSQSSASASNTAGSDSGSDSMLDVRELWSLDLSLTAPWKFRSTVKHSLTAHTGAVTAIDSHANNGIFITGGRDELVKVWSLNIGDGSLSSIQTYRGHKSPIADVRLVIDHDSYQSFDRCVSLGIDGALHLWEIETGQTILASPFAASPLEVRAPHIARAPNSGNANVHYHPHLIGTAQQPLRGEQPQPITAMEVLNNQSVSLLLGTSMGTLRFFDLRAETAFTSLTGPWRLLGSAQPISAVRAMCHSQSWICSGLATGELTVLDSRTGILRMQWRAHEGAIIKVLTIDANTIISSGTDRSLCVWSISGSEPVLVAKYSGLEDSVRHIVRHHNDILCALSQGKLGLTNIDTSATANHTAGGKAGVGKLQATVIKNKKTPAPTTSLNILSPFKWLLVGTEDGKCLITA